ncbi:hypothetical protein [Xanthobacter agilis]|uniref:Uncharacterized protein n=1 Tax=Xanthobacter agilis TaxID=47492 RepID=A0ABU0LB07_XANAG|nr:hypothetical protein [Xanthobacter agilis]MDQ0504316.1 hypothetical protein [Xanthobacter agilis]
MAAPIRRCVRPLVRLLAGMAAFVLPTGLALAAPGPVCMRDGGFLVVELPHANAVGNSYIVRGSAAGQAPQCNATAAPGDYIVGKDEDPFFLSKLAGSYMFIDSGTGPTRELLIYDLKTHQQVYKNIYDSESLKRDGNHVVFWAASQEPATKKTCRDLRKFKQQGFEAGLQVRATFDLGTGKVSVGGKTRCVPYQ